MLLVLLKSSEDPREDPYLLAVQSRFPSVRPAIISPHEFLPLRPSASALELVRGCSVVLFTSPRAVQYYADLLLLPPASDPRWHRQPPLPPSTVCYAVGPATAAAAAALAAGFREVRGGDACGSAAALCDLVIAELDPATDRILFPCGRVRKDTVEMRLARGSGFIVTVLELYDSVEKQSLSAELDSLLSSPGTPCGSEPELASQQLLATLAFFSPSSVSMVMKQLDGGLNVDFKCISIGPSTSQRIHQLCPARPCVECAAPSVQGFLAALARCL